MPAFLVKTDGPAASEGNMPPHGFSERTLYGGPPPETDAGDTGHSLHVPVPRDTFIHDKSL